MSARVWSSDPVKLAKRRGVLGMVAGAVLLVFSFAFIPLGGGEWPRSVIVLAVSVLILAALVFVVSAIALGIARRHPAISGFRRPNDLATVAALVVGVLGVVDEIALSIGQPAAAYLGTGMIVVVLAMLTGAVLVLSAANRAAIRAAESVPTPL